MRHLSNFSNTHTFGLAFTTQGMGTHMSRIDIRIATIAAAAGGLATAFLAMSPTASAEPAAPVIPAVPGINVVQQLANAPALASQLLQNAATMLQPAPATPATSTAPTPTASATLNLPQPPQAAPMTSAVGTVPGVPASSATLPLLNQLGLPSNLSGLSGLPLPNGGAPATPAAPAVPGEPALPPSLNPFSALP
jgi:hypothetical protein